MLTNTEQSFHEAIRSGDTAARLIYADWLEDQSRYYESALLRSGHWRLIPAGSFWTGRPRKLRSFEMWHYFYLGTYPVTQAEWQQMMGDNPSYFSRYGWGKNIIKHIPDEDLRLFPVEGVSWDETQEFIKKLNDKEQDSGFLYRLPNQREWEYSCCGAPSSEQVRCFNFYFDKPTDDLSPNDANFNGNYPMGRILKCDRRYLQRPTKVGSYKPNRLGLYDMHGNVYEWCDNGTDTYKVTCGGSWQNTALSCRADKWIRQRRLTKASTIGFRLAIIPPTR